MALATVLPRMNRATVTPLVLTPIPGPSESARIEFLCCAGVLVVTGFAPKVVAGLVIWLERHHTCSEN